MRMVKMQLGLHFVELTTFLVRNSNYNLNYSTAVVAFVVCICENQRHSFCELWL